MGIASDIAADWEASLAALAWQLEAGVDEVLSDAPVNRYNLPEAQPAPRPAAAQKEDGRRRRERGRFIG